MEGQIKEIRAHMQSERNGIKTATDQLNAIKQEIDKLKVRLDKKEDERRAKNREIDAKHEDMFEEKVNDEDIIDEEELVLLKHMKDQKKQYRDSFAHLKEMKVNLSNNQTRIDVIKEQLIASFEEWYATEFETPSDLMQAGFGQSLQNEYKADVKDVSNTMDEDQATFLRAKKRVETLAKAKRIEKQIGPKK